MSPRLAISIAISVLMMAAFVLSSTRPAEQPFGDHEKGATIQADLSSPPETVSALVHQLLR
jgi:hypothetical protein